MTLRLEVKELGGGYSGLRVFSRVSFMVDSGEILTILGANGSGKSAILQTLQGLLPSSEGNILLDGQPVAHLAAEARAAAGIVLLPDRRWLWPDMTAVEHMRTGAFRAAARPGWQRRGVELRQLFRGLSGRGRLRPGALSGGLQQQLALARFGMSRAQVWLLDDPLQGLDDALMRTSLEWIRNAAAGGAAVVVTGQHVDSLLELGQRAMFLQDGTLAAVPAGAEGLHDPRVRQLVS